MPRGVRALQYAPGVDAYYPNLPRLAFGDESFREDPAGGFYVIAVAIFERDGQEDARAELRALRGVARRGKLHWSDMESQQRHNAAKKIAELGGFHVVVVGAPVPHRRQERARAKCLRRLAFELHSYGVEHLVIESRSAPLNARDVRTVASARYELNRGAKFRVAHLGGHTEPLLWAADIVAGSVRAKHEGEPQNKELLDALVYEIELDTDC